MSEGAEALESICQWAEHQIRCERSGQYAGLRMQIEQEARAVAYERVIDCCRSLAEFYRDKAEGDGRENA